MIRLYNGYVITRDQYNYILQRGQIVQTGKTAWTERIRPVGYYQTLGGALKAFNLELINDRLQEEDELTLKEALAECRKINERFKKFADDNGLVLDA